MLNIMQTVWHSYVGSGHPHMGIVLGWARVHLVCEEERHAR